MVEIPDDVIEGRDTYLTLKDRQLGEMRGYGVDGFIWETEIDTIVKIFRRCPAFERELAVYQRLSSSCIKFKASRSRFWSIFSKMP